MALEMDSMVDKGMEMDQTEVVQTIEVEEMDFKIGMEVDFRIG